MSGSRELVDGFYAAFSRKDGAHMAACYAPSATFVDPMFRLSGAEAGAMWRMFCESKELRVRHEVLSADGDTVTARWVAHYPFRGRPIENTITATMKIVDGKIAAHDDAFDMGKWLRQAYGPVAALPLMGGVLAGLTRRGGRAQLRRFIRRKGPASGFASDPRP